MLRHIEFSYILHNWYFPIMNFVNNLILYIDFHLSAAETRPGVLGFLKSIGILIGRFSGVRSSNISFRGGSHCLFEDILDIARIRNVLLNIICFVCFWMNFNLDLKIVNKHWCTNMWIHILHVSLTAHINKQAFI